MGDLRTPKGTLDHSPAEALVCRRMVEQITRIFERHNAVPIDTPTFELRSVLMNKYGEESKLIYNIEDQGGDICSLRYDLTVPFSRYLAMNRIKKMRRYQIGNVFRRDNPSFRTGRLREFLQADFDICGDNLPMVSDAEVLRVIDEVLASVGKEYLIRINDRRIIMGMLDGCGVDRGLHAAVCSTVDKADKCGWEELAAEFRAKGLSDGQVAHVRRYMEAGGSNEDVVEFLEGQCAGGGSENASNTGPGDSSAAAHSSQKGGWVVLSGAAREGFRNAIDEMKLLLRYAGMYGVRNLRLDLSLARGLDYYTGLIVEAALPGTDVGSVVGGGRYDNLCSSLSGHSVPCVGFSVGVSRLLTQCPPETIGYDVFVGSGYGLLLEERMGILDTLWANGFSAETFTGRRVNFKDQVDYARKNGFRVMVCTGENELRGGVLKIVTVESGEKEEIGAADLVAHLNKLF